MSLLHPFTCRCADCRRTVLPYLAARPIDPDEHARHLAIIEARERLSGIRPEGDKHDDPRDQL